MGLSNLYLSGQCNTGRYICIAKPTYGWGGSEYNTVKAEISCAVLRTVTNFPATIIGGCLFNNRKVCDVKLKSVVLLVSLLAVSGCVMPNGVKLPGNVSSTYSEFDKATETRLEPVWLFSEPTFKIGLFKSTRMAKNDVTFIAEYVGIANIAGGNSLKFSIDGDIVSLPVSDSSTNIQTETQYTSSSSSRSYFGDIGLVKRILNSGTTLAKLSFLDGTYVEGTVISPEYNDQRLDKSPSILPKPAEAFARFLQEIESRK